jgi:hypothetical protein
MYIKEGRNVHKSIRRYVMSLSNAVKSFHAHVGKLSDGTVDGLIDWFSKAGVLDKPDAVHYGVAYMGSSVEDTLYLKEGTCKFAFTHNWNAMAAPDDQMNRFHVIVPLAINNHVLYYGCDDADEKDVELALLAMIVKLSAVKHGLPY